MVPLNPCGGVSVKPARSPGANDHDPSGLSVPWLSVAPAGTPVIVRVNVSDPSGSLEDAVMESGIAVSSLPDAAPTERLGVLATAATAMLNGWSTDAVVPFS